jgi:hypothetical protein
VYELILNDYKIPPWIVNEEFTEEMLVLIMHKRASRIRQERAAADPDGEKPARRVSNAEFFSGMGGAPRLVKKKE